MNHKSIALIVLVSAFLLAVSPAQAMTQSQSQHQEEQPWSREFGEEVLWGSISALATWAGLELLKAPACYLICTQNGGTLCWDGCFFAFTTFAAYWGTPLGATIGVTWSASRYKARWDLGHILFAYAGGFTGEISVILGFQLLADSFPPSQFFGSLTSYLVISIAEGLGATAGFNLWSVIEAALKQRTTYSKAEKALISIQLASF